MDRRAALNDTSGLFDTQLPDKESLLIQFCDHLYRSGFVFDDANSTEIDSGAWVIRDFFEQEASVIQESVPRDRLQSFMEYAQKFEWQGEQLQTKLRQRVLKSFDQLAKGAHHHFNIRYNIAKGIRQQSAHALFDFLLYVEAYFTLALKGEIAEPEIPEEEEPDLSQSNFSIDDLLKLRKEAKEKLEGREFVKGFLSFIAKDQGMTVEQLIPQDEPSERSHPPIQFIRPSKGVPKPERIVQKPTEAQEPEVATKNVDVVESSSTESPVQEDEGALLGFSLEPDLSVMGEPDMVSPVSSSDMSQETGNGSATAPPASSSTAPSAADLLDEMDDDDEDFDDDDDLDGRVQISTDETDVVFGTEQITPKSMGAFVQQYPDSALKFLLRRSLDGRPLAAEIEEVHSSWEKRGLLRPRLKKYIFKIMNWTEVPDLPIHELLQELRGKLFEIKHQND